MMKRILILLISVVFCACTNDKPDPKSEVFERDVAQVLEHYPNGKKKLEGETVNGERHGIWKYYFDNGFLWSEGKYWYGERKGFSSIYYEDGKKQMEGNYKKDLKIGIWKLWNPDGSLNRTLDLDQMLTAEDSVKLELKPAKK